MKILTQVKHAHLFREKLFSFFASSQIVRLHTITLRYKLASLTNIVQHNNDDEIHSLIKESILIRRTTI